MIHERDRRTDRRTDGHRMTAIAGRTDGHRMTAIAALMHSIARLKGKGVPYHRRSVGGVLISLTRAVEPVGG